MIDSKTGAYQQYVAPSNEFDEIHQMMVNTNVAAGDGVPHKRASGQDSSNKIHNMSSNSSNQDVAFNDSAYRIGGVQSVMNMSKGNETNTTKHHQATPADLSNQMTYFLFRSLRLKKKTMVILMTGFLILSLLMERFCFIVTVYKTRYYGYVLILIVIALNCIFNFALTRLRKKKHKKRLHELFNIDRTPTVGWCIIGIIG